MLRIISLIIYGLVITLVITSCSTASKPVYKKKEKRIHAKIYSLSSGEIIDIVTRVVSDGKTKLVKSSKTKSGETFQGEFITLSNSRKNNTSVTLSNTQGKTLRGSEYSRSSSNQQFGSGILVGNKGTVININYTASVISKNSVGEGTDNKGRKYKFTCCEIKYLN